MKALAFVIFIVVLNKSQCRKPTIYTLFLRESAIQVARLPARSLVKVNCGPVSDAAIGNGTNLASIEWFKDRIRIADNYTQRSILVFNDNQELLINGLSKAVGEDGTTTEGNYTCKVCLNQKCSESKIEVVTDLDGTYRHVYIGAQSTVQLPENTPVELDCQQMAFAAFGLDLNLSSIEWFHDDIQIDNNYTESDITLADNFLKLTMSKLTNAVEHERATEGTYRCRACRNEPSPVAPQECQEFISELIAHSPPILECEPSFSTILYNYTFFGCDECLQPEQRILSVSLFCSPKSRRRSNCTIRNPDGLTTNQLDNGDTLIDGEYYINIKKVDLEDPDLPTVLGEWTCTCVNQDGVSRATIIIEECRVALSFEHLEYNVSECSFERAIWIVLTASRIVYFNYTVEISVNYGNTTFGLDNSLLPSFNVTVGAGKRETRFDIQILNEFVVERNKSFSLSISMIYNPSQVVSITWDTVPTTVNIEDDDPDEVLACFVALNRTLTDEERRRIILLAKQQVSVVTSLRGLISEGINFIQSVASLSENNGLFGGPKNTELQMVILEIISSLLDDRNAPAFMAGNGSETMPAVSLLKSIEQLSRNGLVQLKDSIPPNNASSDVIQHVAVEANIAIQASRLNSLSFTTPSFEVRFPSGNFQKFRKESFIPQIIIPGSFLSALTKDTPAASSTTPTPSTTPTNLATNQTNGRAIDVVTFTLDNMQDYLPLQFADEKVETEIGDYAEPGSLIVSIQVVDFGSITVDGGEPVKITFPLLKNNTIGENETEVIHCVFWDFYGRNGSGGWSFDGISFVSSNSTHAQCVSKHLTSFLVLVSTIPIKQKPPLTDPLSWLTYIGCGISLLFLLLCIIFFLSLRKELITHTHNFVHLNLCIALSCGLLFYLGGIRPATWDDIPCKIVAAFLHYFFLAAFTWMLCEAIMIYIFMVEVFGANDRKWIYMYLSLGWGLPVPVVIISVAIKHSNYLIRDRYDETLNHACWLPEKDGLRYAFIGPMLAILLVNLVLIIISMTSLTRMKCRRNKELKKETKGNAVIAWKLIKAILIVMPLMGFTWVIGLFAVGSAHEALAYVFIVLNSLQGFVIFIFHVARHDKVRSKIKAIIQAKTRRRLKQVSLRKLSLKPKDTDPNYSDKKSQTADTLKTISSLDDYKGGQPVREGLENPDRDSSINIEEYEMELRNRDTTSDRANTESSAV